MYGFLVFFFGWGGIRIATRVRTRGQISPPQGCTSTVAQQSTVSYQFPTGRLERLNVAVGQQASSWAGAIERGEAGGAGQAARVDSFAASLRRSGPRERQSRALQVLV